MSTYTEGKLIVLKSCDGETFEVEEAVAKESETIKNIIEDGCAENSHIPLPNVTSKILAKVIQYCKNKVLISDDLKNVDQGTLFDLILAANYLNIKSLLDLTCQTVADMIKELKVEEIRNMFNIENDFTPQQEKELRKENAWAFDDTPAMMMKTRSRIRPILKCFCFSQPSICSESAEMVVLIDDLFIQILLCLPVRSLLRFKSVSKHWCSIITTNSLITRKQKKNPAIGMYLSPCETQKLYKYIPFSERMPKAPSINLDFTENPSKSSILQSINGLMLCVCEGNIYDGNVYYVYNPTTNTKTMIKDCSAIPWSYTLVFDPIISPHYKLVFIQGPRCRPNENYKVWIYSSETSTWSIEGKIKMYIFDNVRYDEGVYCKGSIHWLSKIGRNASLRFHVETRVFSKIPTPPYTQAHPYQSKYFGENCDRLNFVEVSRELNIYELKNDYSIWFVKYKVNLSPIFASYPELDSPWRLFKVYGFSILSLVGGDKKIIDDSMLILETPEMIMKYNLVDGSFKSIHRFENIRTMHNRLKIYRYIESLCCTF